MGIICYKCGKFVFEMAVKPEQLQPIKLFDGTVSQIFTCEECKMQEDITKANLNIV